MQIPTLASLRLSLVVVWFAACAPESADPIAGPDAAPSPVVLDPAGRFSITSTHALLAPPAELAPLLGELAAATDGGDDPTAYLVDLVVAQLPDGNARTLATVLAPYVAAELHGRIAAYAPGLAPAVRALAAGASRIATRFATLEDVAIVAAPPVGYIAQARAQRTLRGVRVDGTDLSFGAIGLPDPSASVEVTVELVGGISRDPSASSTLANQLAIARHVVPLPLAGWFRAAFDRVVVPAIVPGAGDLTGAFRVLVDCPRLGGLLAEAIGFGSPALYGEACAVGLAVAARTIYEQFPSTSARPLQLDVSGTARAADRDGDGVMDAIDGGVWTGRLGDVSVGASVFEGTAR